MEKITFVDNVTKANANTFNTMQDNIENAIEEKQTYSTDEIRIGTFLGKPLYRKVIDFGVLPNNATKTVYHNISDLDFITKVEGISKRSVGDFFTIPYIAGANTGNITLYANSAQVVIITYSDRSAFDKTYIVIEYTKTTD